MAQLTRRQIKLKRQIHKIKSIITDRITYDKTQMCRSIPMRFDSYTSLPFRPIVMKNIFFKTISNSLLLYAYFSRKILW